MVGTPTPTTARLRRAHLARFSLPASRTSATPSARLACAREAGGGDFKSAIRRRTAQIISHIRMFFSTELISNATFVRSSCLGRILVIVLPVSFCSESPSEKLAVLSLGVGILSCAVGSRLCSKRRLRERKRRKGRPPTPITAGGLFHITLGDNSPIGSHGSGVTGEILDA